MNTADILRDLGWKRDLIEALCKDNSWNDQDFPEYEARVNECVTGITEIHVTGESLVLANNRFISS